jgi:hypothetical protein
MKERQTLPDAIRLGGLRLKMAKTNDKIASLKLYNRTAEAVIVLPFLCHPL